MQILHRHGHRSIHKDPPIRVVFDHSRYTFFQVLVDRTFCVWPMLLVFYTKDNYHLAIAAILRYINCEIGCGCIRIEAIQYHQI